MTLRSGSIVSKLQVVLKDTWSLPNELFPHVARILIEFTVILVWQDDGDQLKFFVSKFVLYVVFYYIDKITWSLPNKLFSDVTGFSVTLP